VSSVQIRNCLRQFSIRHIEFAEIVIRIVAGWFKRKGFLELHLSRRQLVGADEIGSKIRSGRSGIGFQTNGILEMFNRIGIPPLCGVDHAEQFMNVEALRDFAHKLLQPHSRLVQMIGIVKLDCFLKLALQLLWLVNFGAMHGSTCEKNAYIKRRRPEGHSTRMLAPLLSTEAV